MRAARTDAGVSAAINVLNLKLILSPPDMPADTTLEAYINSFLTPAIRIWKIIRVTGGFHSRTMCDSRMYNYSLPTYCFLDPRPTTSMGEKRSKNAPDQKNWWETEPVTRRPVTMETDELTTTDHTESVPPETAPTSGNSEAEAEKPADATEAAVPISTFREDQKLRKAYRIPQETIQRLRDTINAYRGSHNYWNFTVGKEFGDRSCQRVMKNLTVSAAECHY